MITVHYLNDSRAHRIVWLLEELGVGYDIKQYTRRADMRAPADLKAIHPLGKSPVIEDSGIVVAETGAIIEYLIGKYGKGRNLVPKGEEEKRRYSYWLHYAEGSAMPLLLLRLIFGQLPVRSPFIIRPFARAISSAVTARLIAPQIDDHLGFWEHELARDGFFAGPDFSAADIMMSFPVETGMGRVDYHGKREAIDAWLAAIRARPAYQKALERGGAYRFAA